MSANLLKRASGINLPHKRPLLWITAIWFCLLLAQLSPCIDMNPDSAIFLTAGRNLSHGKGYTLEGKFIRTHPPLFPLMLSTVSDTAPRSFQPEKALIALCALAALLGGYWLLSIRYSKTELITVGFLLATSPSLLHLSGKIVSDMPFILLSLCFMAAATSYWQAEKTDWSLALVAAIALGFAGLTRSAAIAFYPACLLWLVRPRLWRDDPKRCLLFSAMILILACPPFLFWALRVRSAQGAGTAAYADVFFKGVLNGESVFSLRGMFLLLSAELRVIPSHLAGAASAVFRVGGRTGTGVTAIVLTPIALIGIVRRLRKPSFMDFAFAAYTLMVLCWPSTQGARLWLPVLPLLFGYLIDGLHVLADFSGNFPRLSHWRTLKRITRPIERIGKAAPRWAAIVLLGVGIVSCVGIAKDSWLDCRKAIAGVVLSGGPKDVALFLTQSSDQSIKVAYSRFREVQTAMVGHQVSRLMPVPRIDAKKASETLEAITSSDATHLAVVKRGRNASLGPRLSDDLVASILSQPESFRKVLDTKDVTVFEIGRERRTLLPQS